MLDFLQAALLPVSVQPRRLSLLLMTSLHMIIINKEMLHYLLVHSWDSAPTHCLCGWSESDHEITEQEWFNRLYWRDVWTNWSFKSWINKHEQSLFSLSSFRVSYRADRQHVKLTEFGCSSCILLEYFHFLLCCTSTALHSANNVKRNIYNKNIRNKAILQGSMWWIKKKLDNIIILYVNYQRSLC